MTAIAPAARHLELELHRLRLLARRRMLWLRARFRDDPLDEYGRAVTSDARADALAAGGGAAAAFYDRDPEALALGSALDELDAELATRRASAPTPLVATAALFGLGDFERDVLMLALAPELDGDFGRLCGYLTDDVTRRLPTLRLALELLPGADPAALAPGSRLRRLRLVDVVPIAGEPHADHVLTVDERVAGHLRGLGGLDPRLAALVRVPAEPPLPDRTAAVARDVAAVLGSRAPGEPLPVVNLVARPGAGAEAVAAAACRALGLRGVLLDTLALVDAAARDEGVGALLEREALLGRLAFVLDANDAGPEAAPPLGRIVDALGVPLLVISEWRWHTRRRLLTRDVPWPAPGERAALIRATAGEVPGIGAIAEHFDAGPDDIADAVREATADGDLWRAFQRRADRRIDALAERVEITRDWDDIVLPPEALGQLRDMAAQAAGRARVYEQWGFGAKLGRGRGIAALFAGASGTGKTLAAEILAGELGLRLYRVDLARVVSKYIGETEKNLREVIHCAERAGAMILFDEADSLFAGRTDVRDSRDRYANLQVNYLLQLMEGFGGVAVLATNRRGAIDSAFLRRLRFVVDFPVPDAAARRDIWQRSFPAGAPLAAIDWDVLGALELTGGSIRTVSLNAAFLAAAQDTEIAMRHLMRAARREYAKLDRLSAGVDFGRWEAAA
jgi:ATP-dependent 26S proteasome regulatory subunit